MRQIVVGIDCSEHSAVALRWAAREANLRKASSLVALMAWGYPEQFRGMGRFEPHHGAEDAERAMTEFVDHTIAESGLQHACVTRRAVDGFATDVLLDAAQSADLLVVGARGHGALLGHRLGSVTGHCLEHAPCGVAVVRDPPPRAPTAPSRIVVGYDGSDAAREALRWALDEGRLRHAFVHVVHAWSVPIGGLHPFAVAAFDPAVFEQAAMRALDAALEAADTTGLPGPVGRIVPSAPAGRAILEAAKTADLVVTGSRGLGGFKHLLLGSVAHQVASHATCPVVVHREPRSDQE